MFRSIEQYSVFRSFLSNEKEADVCVAVRFCSEETQLAVTAEVSSLTDVKRGTAVFGVVSILPRVLQILFML